MLKKLTVPTVHGLVNLAYASKQFAWIRPVGDREDILESLIPSTPFGQAERTLDLGILSVIKGLTREQKIELVALMWLGRDGGEWDSLLQNGRDEVDGVDRNLPNYVSAKADLDQYLDDGLEALGLPRCREAVTA